MIEADPKRLVVVLGKETVRTDEEDALRAFGDALAKRDKILYITNTRGAGKLIAEGYTAAGGPELHYIQGNFLTEFEALPVHHPIVVFTNAKMQADLNTRVPDWRERNWIVFHNQKATRQAGEWAAQLLAELPPVEDGGVDDV